MSTCLAWVEDVTWSSKADSGSSGSRICIGCMLGLGMLVSEATGRAVPTEYSGSFKVSYIVEISYYLFMVIERKNRILLTVTILGICFSLVLRPRACIHSSCVCFRLGFLSSLSLLSFHRWMRHVSVNSSCPAHSYVDIWIRYLRPSSHSLQSVWHMYKLARCLSANTGSPLHFSSLLCAFA